MVEQKLISPILRNRWLRLSGSSLAKSRVLRCCWA